MHNNPIFLSPAIKNLLDRGRSKFFVHPLSSLKTLDHYVVYFLCFMGILTPRPIDNQHKKKIQPFTVVCRLLTAQVDPV